MDTGKGKVRSGRSSDVLSSLQLNRALMERQMLLGRVAVPAADMIGRLVGMQAQVPQSPYVGLWSRIEEFRPDGLAELLLSRQAVRAPLMRSTIHLVSARDFTSMWPLARTVLRRSFQSSEFARDLKGLEAEAIAKVAEPLLAKESLTLAALGGLLAKRWPDRRPDSLAYAVRCCLPLVQVTPRGVWGKSGQARWAPAEAWIGKKVSRRPSLRELFLRYLAAFGPASVADFQSWSGLARVRDELEQLRGELRVFHDEKGRELFDVSEGKIPDPKVKVPVRFLPEYDNVLLGHADRSRVFADEHRARIGIGKPTVLIDGFVGATWKIERGRGATVLAILAFTDLSRKQVSEVNAEGGRLLEFLKKDAIGRVEVSVAK